MEPGCPRFQHLLVLRCVAGELPAGLLSDLIRKEDRGQRCEPKGFDSGFPRIAADVNQHRTELERVSERSRDQAAESK